MVPIQSSNLLDPPAQVRGMVKWQPELFTKSVKLPHVDLPARNISKQLAGKILKNAKIKIPNFQSIREIRENDKDMKRLIFDPKMFDEITDEEKRQISEICEGKFGEMEHVLNYTNYTFSEAVKHILPEDMESLSSLQIVGHISYVNLRDELLPYKEVIGQIMLNFLPRTKLVVTKTNTIENKFRNLDLEVLAGDESLGYEVTVKENGCTFKLDFSKVYWNPRLGTEHQRIVDLVKSGDIVFDVFAGVGPFAIPLGVKGKKQPKPIKIYANDLNPSSFEYLKNNKTLNKIKDNFNCYNLDGSEFIKTIVRKELIDGQNEGQVHILMNLPAIATTFLPSFKNLITQEQLEKRQDKNNPIVHVYAFGKGDDKEAELVKECCEQLQVEVIENLKLHFVRAVSGNKDMYRISFPITLEMLTESDSNGNEAKRQ